jgi:hypothetical protein
MDSTPGVSVVKLYALAFVTAVGIAVAVGTAVGVAVAAGDVLVQPLNATKTAQIIVTHNNIFT